jgi:hypothetical protein
MKCRDRRQGKTEASLDSKNFRQVSSTILPSKRGPKANHSDFAPAGFRQITEIIEAGEGNPLPIAATINYINLFDIHLSRDITSAITEIVSDSRWSLWPFRCFADGGYRGRAVPATGCRAPTDIAQSVGPSRQRNDAATDHSEFESLRARHSGQNCEHLRD